MKPAPSAAGERAGDRGAKRQRCSVTVITFNEESNLRACLESVSWADEIIIVDSNSTDATLDIAREFTSAVYVNPWPGWKRQKNFAIGQATHDWIFSIDADERVTPELAKEIERILENPRQTGYAFPRKNYFLGKWMRHGGWHPDSVLRLFRKDCGEFGGTDPHDRVILKTGKAELIPLPLTHFTYKSFRHYISKQFPYADATAREIVGRKGKRFPGPLGIFFKPAWKFLEIYLVKRGFLDGTHGLIAALGATYTTYLKQTRIWELRKEAENKPLE
jgi:glycosyltransferase involved in cell wall biosynthesis